MNISILEIIPILIASAFSLQISLIDIRELRIPNRLLFPGLILTTLSVLVVGIALDQVNRAMLSILGAIISIAIFFCIHLIKPKGLGMGDVKFAALIGLALSWISFPAGLFGLGLAFIASSFFSLLLYMVKRNSFNRVIPFAPFMLLGLVFFQFGTLL